MSGSPPTAEADAELVPLLLAVDPRLGVLLRGPADPLRDSWLARLRAARPAGTPLRRLPVACDAEGLQGGLDLAASLATGRISRRSGVLAAVRGGVLIAPSAELMTPAAATALVRGVEGEGEHPEPGSAGSITLVACDEGGEEDVPPILAEHLAVHLDLGRCRTMLVPIGAAERRAVAAAQARLGRVQASPEVVQALCAAAAAMAINSLRAPLLALRVARAVAALAGRTKIDADEVALAARLCLGPRARIAPASLPEAAPERSPNPDGETATPGEGAGDGDIARDGLEAIAVEAARARLPLHLLGGIQGKRGSRRVEDGGGRGRGAATAVRGRPAGTRPGRPNQAAELDIVATLRAAVPWQAARGREDGGRLRLRLDDLRLVRRRARRRTTTIFAVDASGSAAHGRLAEAKGAVELLLADCYVRRDEVALVGFRGTAAELLLPPTRSLARARRELAELPGGGGTPLAAGLDMALDLARRAVRDGRDAVIAVLTDGRANVARDGAASRPRAEADGLEAARLVGTTGLRTIVIDVAPRPGPAAARLAEAMAARYVPLPRADAASIARSLGLGRDPP